MLATLKADPSFKTKNVGIYQSEIEKNVYYPKENVFLLMKFLYHDPTFSSMEPEVIRGLLDDLIAQKEAIDQWQEMPTNLARDLWFEAGLQLPLAANLLNVKINCIAPDGKIHHYNQETTYPGPLQLKSTGSHWVVMLG